MREEPRGTGGPPDEGTGQTSVPASQPWIDRTPAKRRTRFEAIDQVLRNSKLCRLHEWLRVSIEAYVGLYEAGSLTSGDGWVEGRSDRDVLILLDGPIAAAQEEMIRAELQMIGFSDSYLFYFGHKRRFLRTHSDQDISMKFRGVALFGEDLLPDKETPSPAFAQHWADAGLRTLPARFRIRILNGRFWSEERLRDELYNDLKRMFMFLADRKYAETGCYPRRRADVAAAYGSEGLRQLGERLGRIDQDDRQRLIDVAKLAVAVMDELMAVPPAAQP
jgi:hypothetical protein